MKIDLILYNQNQKHVHIRRTGTYIHSRKKTKF